jgi:hypothetical protein
MPASFLLTERRVHQIYNRSVAEAWLKCGLIVRARPQVRDSPPGEPDVPVMSWQPERVWDQRS